MCTREDVKQLLQENNEIRDKNLDKKLFQLKEELFAHTSKLLEHSEPSKTTLDKIAYLEKCDEEQKEQAMKIVDLLNENQRMTREMYDVFISANWTGKMVLKIFASVGIITGAIIGIIELIKRAKN